MEGKFEFILSPKLTSNSILAGEFQVDDKGKNVAHQSGQETEADAALKMQENDFQFLVDLRRTHKAGQSEQLEHQGFDGRRQSH